jgi:hypothetical protein
MVLNHSDNVRFINLRRFMRIAVNKPAFIARFPFSAPLLFSESKKGEQSRNGSGLTPPEFVSAVVTELAGISLSLTVPFEAKVGERVLVVFKEEGREAAEDRKQSNDNKQAGAADEVQSKAASNPLTSAPNSLRTRIIQDIGEVMRVQAYEKGFSIVVRLTGLSDSNINELVRAANYAAKWAKEDGLGTIDEGRKKVNKVHNAVGKGV